jgi:hypothetical protein
MSTAQDFLNLVSELQYLNGEWQFVAKVEDGDTFAIWSKNLEVDGCKYHCLFEIKFDANGELTAQCRVRNKNSKLAKFVFNKQAISLDSITRTAIDWTISDLIA